MKKINVQDTDPESEWGLVSTDEINLTDGKDKRVFVVDNFYQDPDFVREFALNQFYYKDSGFVGFRTRKQFLFDGVKERFESIIGHQITDWVDEPNNGKFHSNLVENIPFYKYNQQRWVGVVFLSPNAPTETGISFYMDKETKIYHSQQIDWISGYGTNIISNDVDIDFYKYELIDSIGNIYNRLVIFDGALIHADSGYFGNYIYESRLTHIYFFN